DGWGTSYPETTGYIIPTLIAAADHLNWDAPRQRAVLAAEWLLTIQHPEGGRVGEGKAPVVFNTAQAIRGLLAVHQLTGRDEFLQASLKAGHWILGSQSRD